MSGFFKAMRSEAGTELIKANPNAFVLLYVIARRARWHHGFNAHDLAPGEAVLGDYKNYGMSEREYRTAKQLLEKCHFATFKTTNRGTVASLVSTTVFDISGEPDDRQPQPTGNRRKTDGQATDKTTDNNDSARAVSSDSCGGRSGSNDGQDDDPNDRQPTDSRRLTNKGKEGTKDHTLPAVELPRGFPPTLDDALRLTAIACGHVPKEFIMGTHDKALSRGGRDDKDVPIRDFGAYVRSCWKYEQERKAKHANQPSSKSTPSQLRNAGITGAERASSNALAYIAKQEREDAKRKAAQHPVATQVDGHGSNAP